MNHRDEAVVSGLARDKRWRLFMLSLCAVAAGVCVCVCVCVTVCVSASRQSRLDSPSCWGQGECNRD
jgi:hypothetical protein